MVVLDASVGVGIVRDDSQALRFKELILENEMIVAPTLYQAEVTQVFWKYVQASLMGKREAKERIDSALSLVDEYVEMADMTAEVYAEACRQGHSAYDLFYLVLARRRDAALLTLDRRLLNIAVKCGISTVEDIRTEEYGTVTTRVTLEDMRSAAKGL